MNPFVGLEFPGKDEPRIKFMLEEDVRELFSKVRRSDAFSSPFTKSRTIVILSLAYGLGLRLSEIQQLKEEEVDLDKKLVRITRQKNKSVSILPISSRVAFDIMHYLQEKRKLGLEPYFLVVSRQNNHLSDICYRRLSTFIKGIYPGFKGYHSLRHSNATSLLRQ